jgi:ATP-dependent Clp protease ATP-binding subunit ClpC
VSMWEPLTERARRCIVLAQEGSLSLGHTYIGNEHILLGIMEDGQSLGARSLEERGLTKSRVRQEIESIVGTGNASRPFTQELLFTPMAKRTIEFAFQEARQLSHNYISVEHILLGLMRDEDGVAARIILTLANDHQNIRSTILGILGQEPHDGDKPSPRQDKRDDFKGTARCPHCHKPIAIELFRTEEKP